MPLQLTRLTFSALPGFPGPASAVTVLVGPNNSPSLALREISEWSQGSAAARSVVDELEVDWPVDPDEVLAILEPFKALPAAGEAVQADSILISTFNSEGGQDRQWISTPNVTAQLPLAATSDWLRQMILKRFVARLDGRTRFNLMQARPWQDLKLPPQHHLAALFLDDVLRGRVRTLVEEAFPGHYFVIDPTGMQEFRVGMNSRNPADSSEERGWDDRAVLYHSNTQPITSLSDGVVCFSGLVAATHSLAHRVLLIDEPEAFLHPPLARLLGSNLAQLTNERQASLVVATHSSEFLMGCIESGVTTTIVRLTYEQGTAGAKVLPPRELRSLIMDPLLRSSDALSGLFHRGVVVGEADADRAFYSEVNRRLVAVHRGSPDTFFANAQNWQTVPRIVGPLRQLGVPAVAVLDFDVNIHLPRRLRPETGP